jgi:hypothetical protein
MTTTRNPFHNPQSGYSRTTFTYHGGPLFTHRGVTVYKNDAGSWDYVFEGVTIAQRAGFTKEGATRIIDEMMDGLSPHSDAVRDHLRANGHKTMSYAEYMTLWAAGKVA